MALIYCAKCQKVIAEEKPFVARRLSEVEAEASGVTKPKKPIRTHDPEFKAQRASELEVDNNIKKEALEVVEDVLAKAEKKVKKPKTKKK